MPEIKGGGYFASIIARERIVGAKWAIATMAEHFRELQAYKVALEIETLAKAIDEGTVEVGNA